MFKVSIPLLQMWQFQFEYFDSVSLRYNNIINNEEADVEVSYGQTGKKNNLLPQEGEISAEYPLIAKVAAEALFNEKKQRRQIAGWTIMLTFVGALNLTYGIPKLFPVSMLTDLNWIMTSMPKRIWDPALMVEVVAIHQTRGFNEHSVLGSGGYIATIGRDGYLPANPAFDFKTEQLICGGKSYYGALLCCTMSSWMKGSSADL
ncbi:LOW QUALITY PROTEIN: hypothetical protein M8C21_033132 [Ambrosia artemisiifolia]|uniref:Uncharacterized protein n=1 Tax=Ambrosia artemisiifolia TaxID=4212 RepID=A0AAD5D4T6_AMBAR|nr:LOW QUALITY PROTEIN: hypothetical protein M8C21_033132 [Ambrosia artemisiifolia]